MTLTSGFKAFNECICPSSGLIESDWQEIFKEPDTFRKKNAILAYLGHSRPVFGHVQSSYGRQILVNCVFTSVLVRFD